MEKIEEHLYNSFDNLTKKICNEKNNSALFAHFIGVTNLIDLCKKLNINYNFLNKIKLYNRQINTINFNNNILSHKSFENLKKMLDFINILLNNVLDSLQEYNYECNDVFKSIKLEDSINLAYDFLKWYNVDYKNTFLDLFNNKKVIIKDCDTPLISSHGTTYFSYELNDIYVLINNLKSLITPSCIAHEITHAYYISRDNNCGYKKRILRDFNTTGEIASYTTELYFIDYLFEKKFEYEDIFLLINDFDYFLFMLTNYLKEFFYKIDKLNYKTYKYFKNEIDENINNLYGKIIAYYLHSLNDKEKVFYLLDRIHVESKSKNLLEILNNNSIDIEYIESFDYAKKLIKDHWGYRNEKK